MSLAPTPRVALTGVADYSPGPAVGNAELEEVLQAPVQSLMSYFGVETRHYTIDPRTGQPREPGLGTTEMSARAAERAMERAQIDPERIDTLICGTSTPDGRLPPLTYAVQRRLRLGELAMYDMRGGCAVALQCLTLATALIQAGRAKAVLVTLADTISPHYLAPLLGRTDAATEDVINGLTFADGAAAVVVEAAEESPRGFDLRMVSSRSCFPGRSTGFGVDKTGTALHNHRAIRENLPVVMKAAVGELLAAQRDDDPAIDKLIVPQVNRSMVDIVKTDLHEKVFYVGHQIGNCPAPAILRAFALGIDRGEIVPGRTRVGVIAVETASWSYGVSLLQ